MSKIVQLFSDKEKTQKLYPLTTQEAVMADDGKTLKTALGEYVKTVNGTAPDSDGNVAVSGGITYTEAVFDQFNATFKKALLSYVRKNI